MLNIVLFGPPGAGKGTQSEMIVDKFNLTHLSTGDVFRYNIKNETDLGLLAKSFIDKGELVPDQVTNNMVKDFLVRNDNEHGVICDGYPRTLAQGAALDKTLSEMDKEVTMMVALEVSEDELVKRLLERGKTSGRVDDQDVNTIKNRFRVYQEETAPLAMFYSDQEKYLGVHGTGSIEDIFERLCQAIESKKDSTEN